MKLARLRNKNRAAGLIVGLGSKAEISHGLNDFRSSPDNGHSIVVIPRIRTHAGVTIMIATD